MAIEIRLTAPLSVYLRHSHLVRTFTGLHIYLCSLSIHPLVLCTQGKAILTVKDKHQPNKTQAGSEWETERESEHTLPLKPSLCTLFVHWGGGSASCFSSSCRVASPLHRLLLSSLCTQVVKSSTQCVAGPLYIFQMKVCAAKNKRERGMNQMVQAWDPLVLGYPPSFVSGPLLSLSLPAAVIWLPDDVYHDSHYTSVVLSHIRSSLSQEVLATLPLPRHAFCTISIRHRKPPLWRDEAVLMNLKMSCFEYWHNFLTIGFSKWNDIWMPVGVAEQSV